MANEALHRGDQDHDLLRRLFKIDVACSIKEI